MNFNITAYIIFLMIITLIIVVVGRICYANGNIYVNALLPGHEDLCIRVNKLLLTGYYFTNIGYAAMTLVTWETIITFSQLVEAVAIKTAVIISILSVLHYLNIYLITTYIKKLI